MVEFSLSSCSIGNFCFIYLEIILLGTCKHRITVNPGDLKLLSLPLPFVILIFTLFILHIASPTLLVLIFCYFYLWIFLYVHILDYTCTDTHMHAVFLIPIFITFVLTVEFSLLTLNVMMDIFGLNLTFCTVVQFVLCFCFYTFMYYTSLTFTCIYIFIHFPLNMFPGLCSLLYFLFLGVDYVFYDLTFLLH